MWSGKGNCISGYFREFKKKGDYLFQSLTPNRWFSFVFGLWSSFACLLGFGFCLFLIDFKKFHFNCEHGYE